MKKILMSFLLILLSVFSQTTFSQEKKLPPAEVRAEKITAWMNTNLNLNEEQRTRVKDINLKYANLNEKIRNTPERNEKMEMLKSNDKAKDNELKSVLTKEQFQNYLSKKEEMKKEFREEMKKKQ
jgi:hypothetical protein